MGIIISANQSRLEEAERGRKHSREEFRLYACVRTNARYAHAYVCGPWGWLVGEGLGKWDGGEGEA